jgi:ribosomal protein S18 acetylase RimI-like enzyme
VTEVGVFSREDTSCAIELIDSALADPTRSGDYRILIAELGAELAGYICYGPTPMTVATWDLYWLATQPHFQRRGVAAALCQAMEAEVRELGGRLVRVETSSTDGYGAAQQFYERHGYPQACRIPGFYKPGDDLIIMFKQL